MIRNAEYSYSAKGDHGNVGGRVDWDYFVSVARIETTDIPIVLTIRTIDTDSRSQIYSTATKESPTILRGDGTQKQSANAHPSYEDSSGSAYRVPYYSDGVNPDYRRISSEPTRCQTGKFFPWLRRLFRIKRTCLREQQLPIIPAKK